MIDVDLSVITLTSINVVQMVLILLLLLPILDLTTLSRAIKFLFDNPQYRNLIFSMSCIYGIVIFGYGILGPTKSLNALKYTKVLRKSETPKEKLIRIIDATNATRNYLLAGFSLFFMLVAMRLFDYIKFSAKLHEFSNLMGNYDLVDVTVTTEVEQESDTFIIDQPIEEDEDEETDIPVQWPSVANLSTIEHKQIKSFFKGKTKVIEKEGKNISTSESAETGRTKGNKEVDDNSDNNKQNEEN